jgi:hypothetical protein
MWQVAVGQWILDHRAVPETDVYSFTMRGQPWISTQWLAQVAYAKAYAVAGWSGPVVLAASAIAATFALLTKFLSRRLSESTTLVFVAAALALARQIGGAEVATSDAAPPARGVLFAAVAIALLAATVAFTSVHRFMPNTNNSPVAAVAELKKLNLARVFNDYDFGGYLIANDVAPFIDGRTELYGEKFFVDHNAVSGLMEPENLFRLLDEYKIEATLMRTKSAATKLLDHIDGWQKVYADDIATIHVRKAGAVHTVEPAVDPTTK